MEKQSRSRIDPHFSLTWAIFTSAGWAFGLLVGLILTDMVQRVVTIASNGAYRLASFAGDSAAGAFTGLTVGTLQWLLLKQYYPRHRAWVWATALGALVGFPLAGSFGSPVAAYSNCGPLFCFGFPLPPNWLPAPFGIVTYHLGGPGSGVVIGTAIGFSQWLVLKSQNALTSRWILASTLTTAAGFFVGMIVSFASSEVVHVAIAVGLSIGITSSLPFFNQLKRALVAGS